MSPVSLFLLSIAAIFLIGIIGELVFERIGVPDVIWLIAVGLFIGPITGFVSRDALIQIAPYFGALTLVIVLFEGGSALRLSDLTASAARASALALTTFFSAVAVVAPVSMAAAWAGALPDTWTWLHAITLGCIVGGSSSVVIMPAVRKAGLAPRIANLLNLESAITDVLCVVATVACVQIAMSGQADAATAGIALAKSFGIGVGVGGTTGLIGLLFLRRLKSSTYGYPLMLCALLVLFVIVDEMDGSAALAILTAAVIVGNAPQLSRVVGLAKTARIGRSMGDVHRQITFIVKSFFFTFIGAMLSPPWGQIALGLLIGLLLLASRIPAVFGALAGGGFSRPATLLVSVSMPRGMAAGVLAMVPSQAEMAGTENLPVVVFACVLTSILVFAGGFPVLKRQLAARDPEALVGPAPRPEPVYESIPPPEPSLAEMTHPDVEPPLRAAEDAAPEAQAVEPEPPDPGPNPPAG